MAFSKNSSYDQKPFDTNNYAGGPLLLGEFYGTLMAHWVNYGRFLLFKNFRA
jgi:hypothetical protein